MAEHLMLSDRKRVELALIPNVFLFVAVNGANRDDPESQECERLLAAASLAPMADMSEAGKRKILRRIVALHDEVMKRHLVEGALVARAGLAGYHFAKAVMESGYLEMAEGSDIDRALQIMLPALEPLANRGDEDDRAQEDAARMLDELQAKGYFGGVKMAR